MRLKFIAMPVLVMLLLNLSLASAATVGIIADPATTTAMTNLMLTAGSGNTKLTATAVQHSGRTNLLIPGYITLGGTTNRISDDGSALTRNGTAIGGSPLWTNIAGILSPSPRVGEVDVVNDASLGDSATTFLYAAALDNEAAPSKYADFLFNGSSTTGQGQFTFSGNDGVNFTYEQIVVAPQDISLFLVSDVGILTTLNPTVPAGSAYTFDTALVLTNLDSVLLARNFGADRFRVDANSGYTGAGTLFLSDDGTYKSAGGADIWVNTAGTIEPAGGQTTNRLSFTSGAADNATNTVLALDTASLWVNDSAFLIRAANASSNIFGVMADGGGIWGGRFGLDPNGAFSFPNVDGGLTILRSPAWGDPGDNNVTFGAYDSDGFNYFAQATFTINIDLPGSPVSNLSLQTTGTNANTTLDLVATEGALRVRGNNSGTDRFDLNPTIASTGSAVAHFLDTSNVLTNGDSLFLVRNKGVTHARVAGNSGYAGGGTKFLTDDGTYQASSSAATITYTNQFVYNAKVTYNAPVYVTNTVLYINGVDVTTKEFLLSASDLTTALTTGTGKAYFYAPYAMTVTRVKATLDTVQTSGSIFTVDINEAGTSILSTKLTIDNTEATSQTAATPPVISDTAIADNAKITIDIDQVGDGTAKGLIVEIDATR